MSAAALRCQRALWSTIRIFLSFATGRPLVLFKTKSKRALTRLLVYVSFFTLFFNKFKSCKKPTLPIHQSSPAHGSYNPLSFSIPFKAQHTMYVLTLRYYSTGHRLPILFHFFIPKNLNRISFLFPIYDYLF